MYLLNYLLKILLNELIDKLLKKPLNKLLDRPVYRQLNMLNCPGTIPSISIIYTIKWLVK